MGSSQQFCTFSVGSHFFGVPTNKVQEVIQSHPMTRVPLAPEAIVGLMNVRGQIVPVLDLRLRFDSDERLYCPLPLNIVVHAGESAVSLLVHEIGDVIDVPEDAFECPPATLQEPVRDLLRGVYKLPGRLLLALDIDRVVDLETSERGPSRDRGRDDPGRRLANTVRRVQ